MAKAAFIIAQDGFRDEEYDVPKRVLEEAGHEVITVSFARGEARGKLGMIARVDCALEEFASGAEEEYGAIVCIGGPGSKEFWDMTSVHLCLRRAAARGAVVAGICSAAVTLARAGVLAERRATVYPGDAELFAPHVGEYTEALCERDGRFITANGPGAAQVFGCAIRDLL